MSEKTVEVDPETLFKDTFRVFSKDEDGETNFRNILTLTIWDVNPFSMLYIY